MSNQHSPMRRHFRADYSRSYDNFVGPFDNCVTIPLNQGYVTIIDAEDFDKVPARAWQIDGSLYAMANKIHSPGSPRGSYKMHRVVMPEVAQIDHINGNRLDNRKANLRPCTHSENQRNRRKTKVCSSPYKGVYWHKRENKWVAQIRYEGKQKSLGRYQTAEEAAAAYDEFAKLYHGEFAFLNSHLTNNVAR